MNNYEEYYNGFNGSNQQKRLSYLLLYLRNYWLDIIEFDNLTGYALPKGLIDIVNNDLDENNLNSLENQKDYLSYILDDFIIAFNHIVEDINKKIIKENQVVHISKAREFNSQTIIWLSKQSGLNIKDKLSNTSYKINSAIRYNSIDIAENRLFKAVVKTLELYLNAKGEALDLSEQEEYYYNEVFKFLKSDLCTEIGLWENTIPNNTLLSHKNYNVVWKTWHKLNRLDQILLDDILNINKKFTILFFIKICCVLNLNLNANFPQLLLNFDFDEFNLVIKELEAYKNIRFVINKSDSNSDDFIECSISFNKNKIVLNIGDYQTSLSVKNKIYNDRYEKQSCYAVIEEQKIKQERQEDGKVDDKVDVEVIEAREEKTEEKEKEKEHIYKKIINYENVNAIYTEFLKRSMKDFYDIYYQPSNINNNDDDYDYYTGKYAIVDMSLISPNFILNNDYTNIKSINKKLISLKQDNNINLDLSNAKVLKSGCEVSSFYSMLNNLDNNFKEMSYIGSMLSNELDVKKIDYILPDIFSELQLIDINKELSSSLKNASWFSKSIGVVFDWQFSSDFEKVGFEDKDFVLVADILGNKLLLSIVRGSFEVELNEEVPETYGLIWERYPIKVIELEEKEFNYKKIIKEVLEKNGCNYQDADWLIDTLCKEVLLQEDLFIDCKESWFYNSEKIRQEIHHKLKLNVADKIVSNLDLSILEIDQNSKNKIHILLASDMLEFNNNNNNNNNKNNNKNKNNNNYDKFELVKNYNYNKNSAMVGCAKYKVYQKETAFKLWINRLPSLAIKLPYGKFQLIKDLKVDFEAGKKYTQEIEGRFTLPKDLDKYKFPIISEDGTEASEYEVTLESKEFPLEEDVVCYLTMTYEYGAINPYKLVFKPIKEHEDKLKPVTAKWQKLTSYNNQDLKAPVFRPNEDWSLFTRYPKDKGSGTSDLLDWTLRVFKEISNIYNLINGYELNEDYAEVKLNTSNCQRLSISNYKFTFNKDETILVKFKSFKLYEKNSDVLKKNCIVYIILNNSSNSYSYSSIRNGNQVDPDYDYTINNFDDIQALSIGSFNFFPFHTIFFNNRNIKLEDDTYKRQLDRYLPSVFGMYDVTKNNEVKDYLFSLLSLTAGYQPEKACKLALEHLDYKLKNLNMKQENKTLKKLQDKDIKFAMRCIGNLEHSCQVELFEKLIGEELKIEEIEEKQEKQEKQEKIEFGVGNRKLIISLGEVLWKNEDLIFNLDQDLVISLFEKSIEKLQENIEYLKVATSRIVKTDIISELEFILACFRLRDQEKNQNFQELNQKFELSRNNKVIKGLYNTLEDFTEYCLENKINLDSKIKIDLKNIENEYKHIPTLLYATLLTIIGENIDISISGSTE